MTQTKYLLTDAEMARFLVNGYHLAQLDLPDGLNETIEAKLEALESNPGDAITEAVPELWRILDQPQVTGIMTSLAGVGYALAGRHWHCKQAGSAYMHWHQDGANSRERLMEQFLALYYPTDVSPDMGPTIVVPGTHFRNAPTDRMASYTNIRGQIPAVVKAGTVAFTHYDIWHGTAANKSARKRHMIKFGFSRTQPNAEPTWNHNPACLDQALDWNLRGDREDVNNILTFGKALEVGQTDRYKEGRIRREAWNYLMGETASNSSGR